MDHKKTLIEGAYDKIKEMIFHQQLVPGQKLVYSDLGRIFNMSQTPVINALYRLEHEGFVVSEPFRGFYVKKIGLQEAWDLFGVREALETHLVEQVILLAEPRDLFQLEEKLALHTAYTPEVYDRKRFKLDSDFHLQLASISRNRELIRQLKRTFEHFYIRFRFDNMHTERLQSSVTEHRRIIDRIKRKDIAGSREAVRSHVQNARDSIISSLDDDEEIRSRI
jgi:DNA-binding GntR family transcriptional regulator